MCSRLAFMDMRRLHLGAFFDIVYCTDYSRTYTFYSALKTVGHPKCFMVLTISHITHKLVNMDEEEGKSNHCRNMRECNMYL
jgi:hypothetical protein